MSESRPEQPKIIVDSDWKAQAQAEKERLAAAEREKAQKAAPKASVSIPGVGGEAHPDAEGEEGPLEANFKALLGTLITGALTYMGAFPDPQTGRAMVAPEYARFHIDLLAVLQEKTKGNLAKEEEDYLNQALNELRMQFVELMKAVTAMAMKQEAQRAAGGGAPGAGLDPAQASQRLRGS